MRAEFFGQTGYDVAVRRGRISAFESNTTAGDTTPGVSVGNSRGVWRPCDVVIFGILPRPRDPVGSGRSSQGNGIAEKGLADVLTNNDGHLLPGNWKRRLTPFFPSLMEFDFSDPLQHLNSLNELFHTPMAGTSSVMQNGCWSFKQSSAARRTAI